MSLPPLYESALKYFEDALVFFKQYEWIYNYPNTDILINNIFNHFPSHWIEYFDKMDDMDIKLLATGVVNIDCPIDLLNFFDHINNLKPTYQQECNDEITLPKFYRLAKKKAHEISNLAPFINKICSQEHIRNIIDIGSGLGYLSHLLYANYNFKILGVEGRNELCKIAIKNQDERYKESKHGVIYVEHFITKKSIEYLQETINKHFGTICNNVCMVGLHACADLSITILDIFIKMDSIKSLIIMPCCYHRLKFNTKDNNLEIFDNFPKSSSLKHLFTQFNAESFIRRPFLRNACQHTNVTWIEMSKIDHDIQAKNCLFRAILQKVAYEANLLVNRKKRKTGKILKSEANSIENFIENLTGLFSFTNKTDVTEDVNIDQIKKRIKEIWEENKNNLRLIQVLIGFQIAMQSICENLILLDRIEYLKENNIKSTVFKVTNDRISPRCFAFVAIK